MPDFYFISVLKRLDADEKLQYFQLPWIDLETNREGL
jgi:hypothetical protein